MTDLVVLVPDLNTEKGLQALFRRCPDLGCRGFSVKLVRHPRRDSGVFKEAQDFLRPELRASHYAIAVCDLEGCGREILGRDQIEIRIEERLRANGWDDRCCAIVIDPELEAWVWGDRNLLASVTGWRDDSAHLENWLVDRQLVTRPGAKPARPKETLERILRQTAKRRSSSLYAEVADAINVAGCQDQAFAKLLNTLRRWFPA